MITTLIALISFAIGGAIGWYAERLLRYVTALLERKPVQTGVVKTEIVPGAQIQGTGVIKPRTPKEVAADNEKKFNEQFNI